MLVSTLGINGNGGFRVGALPFCFGLPVLPSKEHVFGMAVCLPRESLRNAQRLLTFRFKTLYLNLRESLYSWLGSTRGLCKWTSAGLQEKEGGCCLLASGNERTLPRLAIAFRPVGQAAHS